MSKFKKSPLSKRIPRDFKKNILKYSGMILILVGTISIGSAFQTTLNGALQFVEDLKEDKLQEDGFFETAERLPEDSLGFYKDEKILLYENFYATDHSFLLPGEQDEDAAKMLVFNERKDVDIPVLFAGRMPEKKQEIALSHAFTGSKGIKVGDTVTILGKEYEVCGLVSLPDYTSLFLNNTDLMMNNSHFCAAVVTEEDFAEFSADNLTYRYSYRYEDRDLKKADKAKLVEKMQKQLVMSQAQVQMFLTSEQNQSISFLEMDMGTDGPFIVVFVYILVALIAFVIAIITNSTIEHEATIIGTLRASGYMKGEIVWHYLQPTLIVALVGSALGNLIGYTLMLDPFLDIYYTTYNIGPVAIRFSPAAFLQTTVIPVIIMLVINALMLYKKLSLSPLRFLRRDLKKGKQKKAVKLPDFSFLSRFRLRVILQNKGSYIILFLGIFLSSFLLMFGIGLSPLMDHYTEVVDESLPYDYQYMLKAPTETEGGENIRMYEMVTWFALGQKDLSVSLMGIRKDSAFFPDAVSESGVAVSSALSKKLGVKEGGKLHLKDEYREKEYDVTVEKVVPYDAAMAVFMETEDLNELLEEEKGYFNCILSNKELEVDEKYLAKMITRQDLLGAADQMMDSFDIVIKFINLFSVAIYLILMYILTKLVIDKNALSISFMKVFGYEPGEIRKLYLTATTIVVMGALVICIPVEAALFKVILVFLSALIEGYLDFYLPVSVYLEIIVIGVVTYFLINAVHVRGIKKIPMTDALKNRE